MKAFIYERVSSEEQAKYGYSLDAQHEALVSFCKANGHIIVGEYRDEGISGRKPYTKRPAMFQLLQDIEAVKPDIILFTKLDRWFRNIKEYYKVQDILDKHKVGWKAIQEEYDTTTASGRLYINIKLSIAQDEADRTSERVKAIQSQLVAQGKVLGGSVPFGYKIVDKHLVFDDTISITKEAIDYYMLHQSANATTRYINDKYGLHFTHPNLVKLFRNPILKGEYRDNPNFCEALLTPEQWDDLQRLLGHNIKRASHRVFLFTGMVVCPVCGRRLGGCASNGYKYYRCTRQVDHDCTFAKSVSERKLEAWLLDNIEDDFKVNVKMKPKKKKDDPQKYRDRLKRLNDMYLMGNISHAEYKEISASLQKQIADLSKTTPLKTQNFVSNWKDLYLQLDEEHRRSFWHGLLQQIVVNEQGQGVAVLYQDYSTGALGTVSTLFRTGV